jgi:hypothetical protein
MKDYFVHFRFYTDGGCEGDGNGFCQLEGLTMASIRATEKIFKADVEKERNVKIEVLNIDFIKRLKLKKGEHDG